MRHWAGETGAVRLLTIAVTLAMQLLVLAPAGAGASFSPRQERQMRDAVKDWKQKNHYPGLEAGVWQQGVGSFRARFGFAQRDSHRRLSYGDHFQVGSITKTFTATLVLQLVERGKLRLDDPVSEYVGIVPHGDQIAIRNLLNMTSGIHTYSNGLMDAFVAHPYRNWRPLELVRRSVHKKRYCPIAQVGTESCEVYTNTNYILLGLIIKRVTDQPLRKLYARRIFKPLGMDETTFNPRHRAIRKPAAHGYIRDRDTKKVVDTTHWNLSYAWTAGGARSTLTDLRRWARALATGRGVLGERMQRKRLQFVPIPESHGLNAYGLGIFELRGGELARFSPLRGHDGQTFGYDSFILYSPPRRIAIAALGNTSTSADPVRRSPADSKSMFFLTPKLLKPIAPSRG
jgi:D-alanyl-D-alanine carboxypeptidase